MRTLPLSLALSLASLGACATPPAAEPARSPAAAARAVTADDLAWFAGVWAVDVGDSRTEEYWTAPRGGMLLGAGVELEMGRLAFFEHLRIEQHDGVLQYVALPNGGAAVAFPLTRSSAHEVVFENAAHDFPKRITYRLDGATLVARIDDGTAADARATEWRFERVN